MNLRRWVADLLIRLVARLDPSRPHVVDRPGGGTEVHLGDVPLCRVESSAACATGTGEIFRVTDQRVNLRHEGARSTTMWTKPNSSSGKLRPRWPQSPRESM